MPGARSGGRMSDLFKEYRQSFFDETDEHLSLLNDSLIAYEKDKDDSAQVDRVFRVLHTLKSSAAAVGYDALSDLAHRAEDHIVRLRSGRPAARAAAVDVFFKVVDAIREYVESAKLGGESAVALGPVLALLDRPGKSERGRKSASDRGRRASEPLETEPLTEYERAVLRELMKKGKRCHEIRVEIDPVEPSKWLRAELVINHVRKAGEIVRVSPPQETFLQTGFDGRFRLWVASDLSAGELLERVTVDLLKRLDVVPLSKSSLTGGRPARPGSSDRTAGLPGGPAMAVSSAVNTIRVPVHKLDSLMHFIGELVIANSGMKLVENRLKEKYNDDLIKSDMNLLNDQLTKVTLGLQTDVLNMRMLPIGTVFGQFHRIVRDLARREGKDVEFVVSGEDTELDKKVIDAMGEPLMHLVRNAVDHGIEPSAERSASGKPGRGTLTLAASQSGNRILVSVKDDGRGIDPARLRARAVDTGFLTREQALETSDDEALSLVFEPGFSTSEKVDAVSGRGVGLDVVHNAIDRLNGSVRVHSEPGKGTEFLITLPLTLAILTVIVVESAGEAYAIPIADIRETIKVRRGTLEARGVIHAISWADEVVPVARLDEVFPHFRPAGPAPHAEDRIPVVIVAVRDTKVGLAVDRIAGKHEIVLKPLETHYRSVKGLSGAALLGDGSIVLVADVVEIVNQLKAASGHRPSAAAPGGVPVRPA
jgi:two-component system, chemotaxis family, sensor kinase CheA